MLKLFDNSVFSFILFLDKHLEFYFSIKQDPLYNQLKLKILLIKVTKLLAKIWVYTFLIKVDTIITNKIPTDIVIW